VDRVGDDHETPSPSTVTKGFDNVSEPLMRFQHVLFSPCRIRAVPKARFGERGSERPNVPSRGKVVDVAGDDRPGSGGHP
jgi:hypothetical protein